MPVPGAAYESESVIEADDFYPYGAIRIDTKSGGYGGEKRKYAATEYDSLSGLNHAMARYQNPTRGQFISEDPVFVGDPKDQNLKDPQGLNSARTMGGSNSAFASGWNGNTQSRGNSTSGFSNAWLRDPQGQNSYAYGRANPIRYVDPQGDWYKEVLTSQQSLSSFQIEVGQAAGQLSKDSAA